MKRRAKVIIATMACLLWAACEDRPTEPGGETSVLAPIGTVRGEIIPDEYLVDIAPGADAIESVAAEIAAAAGGVVMSTWPDALRGFSVRVDRAGLDLIRADARVELVIPNHVAGRVGPGGEVPEAADEVAPMRSAQAVDDGAGVGIYILDSGINPSTSSLAGRLTTVGDFVGDGRSYSCNSHGTTVARYAAGDRGYATGARVYDLRVAACTGTISRDAARSAIAWVIANHQKPAVINFSGFVQSGIDSEVLAAVSSGITFVAASNNWYDDDPVEARSCSYYSPSGVEEALVVGAGFHDTSSDPDYYGVWYRSVTGPCVDVFAPVNPTSWAAPLVAGVAALFLQRHKLASPSDVEHAIEMTSFKNLLLTGWQCPTTIQGSTTPTCGELRGAPNRLVNTNPNASYLDARFSGNTYPYRYATQRFSGMITVGDGGTYTFVWERQPAGSTTWTYLHTGGHLDYTLAGNEPDFTLRLTTTSSTGARDVDLFSVLPQDPPPLVVSLVGPSSIRPSGIKSAPCNYHAQASGLIAPYTADWTVTGPGTLTENGLRAQLTAWRTGSITLSVTVRDAAGRSRTATRTISSSSYADECISMV